MPIVIELADIVKTYDQGAAEVQALRGVSLKIHAGEFVAIRGSSGSGKSTLMNILGCLDRPTKGTYYLDGKDVQRMTKTALAHLRNRQLGFVFQGFNLLKRMNALENVEMPLVYAGISPRHRRATALRMLELVNLKQRAYHRPNQLSGGQQQRVAIARALVNEPQILFADEPTGNLDSKTGEEILAEFERLNRELGQTIVMVTHDMAVAQRAPREVFVRDGLIAGDSYRNLPRAMPNVDSLIPRSHLSEPRPIGSGST
jgi:putative ABC transport system ATP-binding protein